MELLQAVPTNGAMPQPDVPNAVNDDHNGDDAKPDVFAPSTESVDATVLDEVEVILNHHLHLEPDDAAIATLWTLQANVFGVFKASPRLVITAGQKGCGKSTVLEMLSRLVSNRYDSINSATAPLLSTLSGDGDKAFFLDQANRWVSEDVCNWLEAGWQKNAKTLRLEMNATGRKPKQWNNFAAVALAGIDLDNKLGDAVLERSHTIRLQRAMRDEIPEPYDDRKHQAKLDSLAPRLLRFALDIKDKLAAYEWDGEYPMPDHLINRDRDRWEPFFAIASVVGGDWYNRCLQMVKNEVPIVEESLGVELLRCLVKIYNSGNYAGAIKTKDLVRLLCRHEFEDGNSYRTWNSKQDIGEAGWITSREFNKLLRPFGKQTIPATHRVPSGDPITGYQWGSILDVADHEASTEKHYE